MKRILSLSAILSAAVWISGCDMFGSDSVAEPEHLTAKIYSTERGLGIVDLAASYPGFDPNTMEIVTKPNAGSVTRAGSYLLYEPRLGSVADQFTIRITGNGRQGLVIGQIVPNEAAQCDKDPVKYVSIPAGSSVTIDLFDSKDFCGYDRTKSGVGIGTCIQASENGDSNTAPADIALTAGLTNHYAVFTYAPKKGFVGQYKLKYVVVAEMKADIAQGDESWCTDRSYSKYYSQNEIVIDVTN